MKTVYPDGVEYDRLIIESELFEVPDDFTFFVGPVDQDEFHRRVKDAQAVLLGCTKIDPGMLTRCPELKTIVFLGIGVWSYIDFDEANRLGIAVSNTPHYGDDAVAEHALALFLAASKNLIPVDREVRKGLWNREREGVGLRNKTLGIVGLGGIGAAMAQIGIGLGMKILCWTRSPSPERAAEHGVVFSELDYLLTCSDFISIHLPLTPETTGLISEREFSLMKEDAILVNTARSEIVDTQSLVLSLKTNRIRAAGIDVFDNEPPGSNHPLFECENVVLSPHVGFNVREANINILRIGLNNVMEFMKGNPLNVLNMEALKK
ncbi:MAG: glycerate dehydrogenase [Deltaproteobacteria bacterium]|jgi:phosphoglycerate dehydrogenase-like enzyme|uniref:2-hydroxyacid dehydrogenase n=1 Tax=Desulfobacula sp. TaxID=2593537 RepID=UPI002AEB4C0B|nr:glycerate dehydrogenase [Deltaproteobacteria bacterium]MBT5972581.1 glycerate dehydrogenase [Desulfobacula sp.]